MPGDSVTAPCGGHRGQCAVDGGGAAGSIRRQEGQPRALATLLARFDLLLARIDHLINVVLQDLYTVGKGESEAKEGKGVLTCTLDACVTALACCPQTGTRALVGCQSGRMVLLDLTNMTIIKVLKLL
jgi:hypothetical protein